MKYIAKKLREEVRRRANGCCEYCLLPDGYDPRKHEIDHIRAEKHGGKTELSNLCLSCFECNRYKGTDLSSVDPLTDEVEPLYHPLRDKWTEHFRVNKNGTIDGITPKGRVTVQLFRFNYGYKVSTRRLLIKDNRYPIKPLQ